MSLRPWGVSFSGFVGPPRAGSVNDRLRYMLEVGLAQKAREARAKAAKEKKDMEMEEVEPTSAPKGRTLPSFSSKEDKARGEAGPSCPPEPCIKRVRLTDDRIIEKLRELAEPVPLDLHPEIGIPGKHITLRVVLGPEDNTAPRYGGAFWLSIRPDALPKDFNRANRDLFRLLISTYLNEGLIPCNDIAPIDYIKNDKNDSHFEEVLEYAAADMRCEEQWREAFRMLESIFHPAIFPAPKVHVEELSDNVTLVDITMEQSAIAAVMSAFVWRYRLESRAEEAADRGGLNLL